MGETSKKLIIEADPKVFNEVVRRVQNAMIQMELDRQCYLPAISSTRIQVFEPL